MNFLKYIFDLNEIKCKIKYVLIGRTSLKTKKFDVAKRYCTKDPLCTHIYVGSPPIYLLFLIVLNSYFLAHCL